MQILLRNQDLVQKRMQLNEKSLQWNQDTISVCSFFIRTHMHTL